VKSASAAAMQTRCKRTSQSGTASAGRGITSKDASPDVTVQDLAHRTRWHLFMGLGGEQGPPVKPVTTGLRGATTAPTVTVRSLIASLENVQDEDGAVAVPPILERHGAPSPVGVAG
jgi:hypothetical protein